MSISEMEVDSEAEAKQAYAEMEGNSVETPKKKPEESEAEPVEKQPVEETAQPSEEKETEEPKEGDVPAEEKTDDEQKPEEKKEDEKPAEDKKEESVEQYAVKHGLTYAEAKEDLDRTKAIIEKYKGDPIEMARALRSTQSEYDKLKSSEEKKTQSAPINLDFEQVKKNAKAWAIQNREGLVAKYRNDYPGRTELMSDDAILEWATDDAVSNYKTWALEETEKLKRNASELREKFIQEIPKEDVKFLSDIKLILQKTPDAQIASDGFSIKPILFWAKGQRYDDDVKSAYERGLKQGKEGTKILGAKTGVGGSAKPKQVVQSSGLSDAQKNRALSMFPLEDGYTEEQAYASFKEVHAEDLKKNPKFVS